MSQHHYQGFNGGTSPQFTRYQAHQDQQPQLSLYFQHSQQQYQQYPQHQQHQYHHQQQFQYEQHQLPQYPQNGLPPRPPSRWSPGEIEVIPNAAFHGSPSQRSLIPDQSHRSNSMKSYSQINNMNQPNLIQNPSYNERYPQFPRANEALRPTSTSSSMHSIHPTILPIYLQDFPDASSHPMIFIARGSPENLHALSLMFENSAEVESAKMYSSSGSFVLFIKFLSKPTLATISAHNLQKYSNCEDVYVKEPNLIYIPKKQSSGKCKRTRIYKLFTKQCGGDPTIEKDSKYYKLKGDYFFTRAVLQKYMRCFKIYDGKLILQMDLQGEIVTVVSDDSDSDSDTSTDAEEKQEKSGRSNHKIITHEISSDDEMDPHEFSLPKSDELIPKDKISNKELMKRIDTNNDEDIMISNSPFPNIEQQESQIITDEDEDDPIISSQPERITPSRFSSTKNESMPSAHQFLKKIRTRSVSLSKSPSIQHESQVISSDEDSPPVKKSKQGINNDDSESDQQETLETRGFKDAKFQKMKGILSKRDLDSKFIIIRNIPTLSQTIIRRFTEDMLALLYPSRLNKVYVNSHVHEAYLEFRTYEGVLESIKKIHNVSYEKKYPLSVVLLDDNYYEQKIEVADFEFEITK